MQVGTAGGPGETAGAPDADDVPPRRPHGPARLGDVVRRHPLLTVAVLTALVAVGHAIWIWTHRRVGAYDPDEAGYIANAFRFRRSIDLAAPWVFVREVATTGTGPIVPLLSVPLLLLGPTDPRTVMMIQPVLLVVASVGVAGVTRRLAGAGAAVVAGVVFSLLPTVVLATQSYWLGLGATTCCILAVWALLRSEDLADDWVVLFGALVGVMVMARTMTLGFVPGLFLGGVVLAGRRRRSWAGLVRAGLTFLLVAGGWWLINLRGLTEYLLSYGYGPRAAKFGQGGPLERLRFRYERVAEGTGMATMVGHVMPWIVGVALVAALVVIVARTGAARRVSREVREGGALAMMVLGCVAALVSTSNNGVWFELPVVALLVALGTAVLSATPRPVRFVLAAAFIGSGLLGLTRYWWLQPPDGGLTTSHYEYGFAQYDARFGPDRRDEAAAAARDWATTNAAVARAISEVPSAGFGTFVEMSGNMQLLNSNSVGLAGELAGRPMVISIPDTYAPERELREVLRPFPSGEGGGVEKVVVIARHRQTLFTPDERVDRFDRLAADLGWREWRTVPMPDGGEVVVLRHPASGGS